MNYLLDTDCCVYLFAASRPHLNRRVEACEEGSLAVSAISFAELAHGIHNGKMPSPAVLAAFIEQVPVLPFDTAAAEAYAGLPFRRGRFDRLIAAHALARGLIVITNNQADFADIPGLRTENWTLAA